MQISAPAPAAVGGPSRSRPPGVANPTKLQPGFVAIHPERSLNLLVGMDPALPDTPMQADIGYGFSYGARAIVNLTFGQAQLVQPSPVFGDAWKQAAAMSAGEDGAVAIVREGAQLVLRQVLQPAYVHAYTSPGSGAVDPHVVPFRPADGLQEWSDLVGQRAPRFTHGVSFRDPNVLGIVDDGLVVRNPAAAAAPVAVVQHVAVSTLLGRERRPEQWLVETPRPLGVVV